MAAPQSTLDLLPFSTGPLTFASLIEQCPQDVQNFAQELAKDEASFSPINVVHAYLRPQDFPNVSLSSKDEFTAQRRLFSYRLLDVSSWRSMPIPSGSVEAASRPSIPENVNNFLKNHLRDWSAAILDARNVFAAQDGTESMPKVTNVSDANDLFNAICDVTIKSDAMSMLRNVLHAIFHLKYLLAGKLDFPNTMGRLKDELKSAGSSVPHYGSDRIKLSHLRVALYEALTISPIALFSTVPLHNNPFSKDTLLQTWKIIGPSKPPALMKVEQVLWNFLWSCATEACDFMSEMRSALEKANDEACSATASDLAWFYPGNSLTANGPSIQEVPNDPPASPSSSNRTSRGQLPGDPPTASPPPSPHGSSPSPHGTPSTHGGGQRATTQADATTSRASGIASGSSGRTRLDAAKATPPLLTRETRSAAAKRAALAIAAAKRPLPPDPAQRRRNPPRKGLNKPPRPSRRPGSPKRSKVLKKICYSEMRLLQECSQDTTVGEILESVVVQSSKIRGPRALEYPMMGSTLRFAFTPEFHFQADVDLCYKIHDIAMLSCIDGVPRYIANPNESRIAVYRADQFKLLGGDATLRILREKHILVYDSAPSGIKFDEAGLGTLVSSLHKEITIHDFSIEEDDNNPNCRQTIGSPIDLIKSAEAGGSGKALNGLDFPITYDNHSLPPYSTDAHAWDMTSGRQFCRRQEGYPFATMKFGLASTAGTFSRLHMDPNGHGTYINVSVGVKIWHTLTPKPGKTFAEAFGCIDPFKGYDVEMPNPEYWDIETVVLLAGMTLIMRPNTLHFVFTPAPSICRGGYYYGSTVMSDTCFAIYHTFVQGYSITNSDHESQGFDLLWRIVCYYHDQFSQTKVPLSEVAHLPDISTFEGIMETVYLACVIELANVVMKRSYPPSSLSWTERYRCIAARSKARTLLTWVSQRYELHSPDGEVLNAFDDIFSRLLGQHAAVLLTYRQENTPPENPSDDAPHVSVSALKVSLENCLANNVTASTTYMNICNDAAQRPAIGRTFAWVGPVFQVRDGDPQASLKSLDADDGLTYSDILDNLGKPVDEVVKDIIYISSDSESAPDSEADNVGRKTPATRNATTNKRPHPEGDVGPGDRQSKKLKAAKQDARAGTSSSSSEAESEEESE